MLHMARDPGQVTTVRFAEIVTELVQSVLQHPERDGKQHRM